MKRIIVVTVALAFVLLSAGAAMAAISGSKHDMRTHLVVGAGSGYDEVCVYCHTPHSASTAAQLWNRTTPANGTYAPYTSSTMDAVPTSTIGAGSLLCMSCHDGTIAVDAMVNTPNYPGAAVTDGASAGVGATKLVEGAALMGTDLSNDHPIGFDYGVSATAEGPTGLIALATVASSTYVRLIAGTQVECATCHDAHNTVTMPFLRSTNQGSLLCLRCHVK